MDLPWEACEMISSFCENKCEGANDTIYAMIDRSCGGIENFVDAAISVDGRGHFMNSYDGNEDKVDMVGENGEPETYYIYRMD